MKIVCDSCSAKYSIADEKVAGRVFKIRCKKCGAAIVVRGDQVQAQADEESTRVVDYSGDAVWHVVVDGDQQGPYAAAQIGEMLSTGTITWDVYVWREGFDDWKPAQDVEELVSAVMSGAQPAGMDQRSGAAASDVGSMGADPFGGSQGAAVSGVASEDPAPFGQEAAVASRDAGADLFAQTDAASPFGGGADEEDEDVVASSPIGGPRVSAEQALTGARNENSVLFSLSNLQALATGGSSASPASSPSAPGAAPSKAGMASGEGSGLIDIRALAAATGVTGDGLGAGGATPGGGDRVDDLLSIGGASGGGLGSSLGAPVVVPERRDDKNQLGLYVGLGVAGVAVIAAATVVAVVMLKDDPDPATTVAAAGAVDPGQGVNTADSPTAVAATGAAGVAATGEQEPSTDSESQTADATRDDRERDGETHRSSDRGTSRRAAAARRGRRERESSSSSSPPPAAAPSSDSSSSSSSGGGSSRRRGGDDIDSLLEGALGGGGGGGSRRSSSSSSGGGGGGSSGPATPGRSDVVSAMQGVSGAVSACGGGTHGMATVRVVFGSNGRVRSADVSGGNFPPAVRSCIARAVRGARVPPFQQSTFSVNYPFRL